jgi:hypothetical protein
MGPDLLVSSLAEETGAGGTKPVKVTGAPTRQCRSRVISCRPFFTSMPFSPVMTAPTTGPVRSRYY